MERWHVVDKVLLFGLKSDPKIYCAVADSLQWMLIRDGVEVIHYLDHFLLFGPRESPQCAGALAYTMGRCRELGVPVASHKTEGPSTTLVFLGIEVDMARMTVHRPVEKLERLWREIGQWIVRKSCTQREFLSLIGQLQHACCVVRPGCSFLR